MRTAKLIKKVNRLFFTKKSLISKIEKLFKSVNEISLIMLEKIKEYIEARYSECDYPSLTAQTALWSIDKPLAGLKILDATPVFSNTLTKYIPILEAGAELSIGLLKTIKADNKVIDFLKSIGMSIISPNDNGQAFDIILDCGAEYSNFNVNYGYVELTRSGVDKYKDSKFPVFVADSGQIKFIETSLGTGDGYLRALQHLGYSEFKEKLLVIFGSGKVGKGIKSRAISEGFNVIMFDENSAEHEVKQAIFKADYIVSATGVKGALERYADELVTCHGVLANMGVEDEYGDYVPASRVLSNKLPLNFILEEPTHLRYIETTMALHNLGAFEVMSSRDICGLIEPSPEIEAKLLETVRSKGCLGYELDSLHVL